jgi:hypothetical protein
MWERWESGGKAVESGGKVTGKAFGCAPFSTAVFDVPTRPVPFLYSHDPPHSRTHRHTHTRLTQSGNEPDMDSFLTKHINEPDCP